MTAPHSTPTCMTLTLPRRFLPFLFALAVSIALALPARQLLRENPHSFGAAFTALFAIVLALVALWRALRQARYVLRPESLHLDRHGLHIRHHAVAWRTLHLRPADILELKHDGATLTLDWRDSETTRHATLRLHRACYSDVSGKTRRGQAAVVLFIARLGQQLPSPAAPARASQPFQYQWQFSRHDSDSDDIGCMLILLALPALAVSGLLAVSLNTVLHRTGIPGSMLITTTVLLLALCSIMLGLNHLWLRHDSRPAPTLRLECDGVHYQNDRDTLHIPWVTIVAVETEQHVQEDGNWRCAVHLYWQPHAKAAALRHRRINTSRPTEPQGDSRDITRHIAQLVRAHSPNFGKARDLPVSSR